MPQPLIRGKLSKQIKISIILDEPDKKLLDELAESYNCSASEVVRTLIRVYGPKLQKA